MDSRAARQIWLSYFNRYLFEKHVITEEQYRKMQREISKKNVKQS